MRRPANGRSTSSPPIRVAASTRFTTAPGTPRVSTKTTARSTGARSPRPRYRRRQFCCWGTARARQMRLTTGWPSREAPQGCRREGRRRRTADIDHLDDTQVLRLAQYYFAGPPLRDSGDGRWGELGASEPASPALSRSPIARDRVRGGRLRLDDQRSDGSTYRSGGGTAAKPAARRAGAASRGGDPVGQVGAGRRPRGGRRPGIAQAQCRPATRTHDHMIGLAAADKDSAAAGPRWRHARMGAVDIAIFYEDGYFFILDVSG